MSKHLWDVIRGNRSSIWVEWIYRTRLRDRTVWTVSETMVFWGWKKLLKLQSLLLPHIRFLVGDGMTFSLWKDPWHKLGPLVHLFPRRPNLTRMDVVAPLASVIINGQWVWPVQGYRCNSIEFLQILHSLPTIHGGVDRVEWKHNGGTFSTASVYDHFRTPGPKIGWSSLLSGVFKIPRNSFILWLAILGKLSTLDKPWLSHLVDGLPETHDHLFFECTYARQCLASIRRQTRFPWPYHDWRRNILWASRAWRGKHIVHSALRAPLASITYHIWQERNRRRFQGAEQEASILGSLVVEDIRQRIISVQLKPSASTFGLYHCGESLGLSRVVRSLML
ncbi:UNVERIFIED_CONTAM: hypothetical protein Sradi_3982000 [Sesamum radiatum]|uniref:Reverse transcriptase zinc-binding domain-containing protein n=1 Tax=Sesamum radiatum TaxID=300843 RepID=A0AAW2PIJ4_SESRA